ncbi:hypothetical protein BH09ACT7_BH09ACT7_36360 [soil metagenome]
MSWYVSSLTIELCLGIFAATVYVVVVLWKSMLSFLGRSAPFLAIAAVAASALVVIAVPSATAAPTSDDQGYLDSTARCSAPSTAVAFGSTASSRVAICETSGGEYQYRGVRVRDGAKLILPATSSGDAYVAENNGITYTVTASSLTVSNGTKVIREEAMVEYKSLGTSTTSPTTPSTSATPAAPATTATPTPSGPPLPAEVGGSGS